MSKHKGIYGKEVYPKETIDAHFRKAYREAKEKKAMSELKTPYFTTPGTWEVWKTKSKEALGAYFFEKGKGEGFRLAAEKHEKDGEEIVALQARVKELEGFLHSLEMHPEYEYETTKGMRKDFDEAPPMADGRGEWQRNIYYGDKGWERFDYHEEAYWMRPKSTQQKEKK